MLFFFPLKNYLLKTGTRRRQPLVYENTPSFITLPITVKLKDIENQTNITLNGLIYEDNDIEDDDIEIRVWKLASITIENTNEKLGESKPPYPKSFSEIQNRNENIRNRILQNSGV
jgi:hypothetical protein